MRSTRGRDTKPELLLRSELHARGLRYRVATRPLPSLRRTADLVFRGSKLAVFVDGCFWHGCPAHYQAPTANGAFWAKKVDRNRERDADTNAQLEDAGWHVLRVWEHVPPAEAADQVAGLLKRLSNS